MDQALRQAVNWTTFVLILKEMGYEVSYGRNIKYAKLRPKGAERAIRFKSLGIGYSEQELRAKLENHPHRTLVRNGVRKPQISRPVRLRGTYYGQGHKKITGFMALYYHYLYLFGKVHKRQTSFRKTHFLLWEDFRTFERYKQQAQFIWDNKIQTTDDLQMKKAEVSEQIDHLTAKRQTLYKQRSNSSNCMNKGELSREIASLTQALRELRKELRCCDTIEKDAEHLKKQVEAIRSVEREAQKNMQHTQRKEKCQYEYGR